MLGFVVLYGKVLMASIICNVRVNSLHGVIVHRLGTPCSGGKAAYKSE